MNAVLIDLDTMYLVKLWPSGKVSIGTSMGIVKLPNTGKSNCALLDWKQWGLMAAFILEGRVMDNKSYHNPDYEFEVYSSANAEFFRDLLTW